MPRIAFPTNAAPQSVRVRRNQFGLDGDAGAVASAAADDEEAIIKEVLLLLVVVEAPSLAAVVVGKNPPLRSDTGTTFGTMTLLPVVDAPGSTANRVDTRPEFWSTGGAKGPATRLKSSSTKTADGCVSRTNCPAKAADCSEMCAVPSK